MLWQPKRILVWTFITVLAVNCHGEVRRKPKKLFDHKPNKQRQKTSCEQLIQCHSMNSKTHFLHSWYYRKSSAAKTYDTIGVCSASCHLWRNGWDCCCSSSVTLTRTIWIWSPVEINLPWTQTKQAKGSQQQKVPKQSNPIVKF